MKVLVVAAHPNFEKSRVNKRWIEELKKHDEITISNLNEKYPNENIDKEAEQKLLLEHDRIVFQYPWHWYNMPPIMRKWQDLVLEYGWAFGSGGTQLNGKEYVVATAAIPAKKLFYSSPSPEVPVFRLRQAYYIILIGEYLL